MQHRHPPQHDRQIQAEGVVGPLHAAAQNHIIRLNQRAVLRQMKQRSGAVVILGACKSRSGG